ncbi:MAG: hypothetical protein U0Z26_10020 [Anaerolineales bacterium]
MFRRRPPRAGFRREGRAEVHPLLRRANNLLMTGQFAEAAEAFEQLANGALARQGPRAPVFFLQAGRARILNGQSSMGIEHLKHGLKLFADRGDLHRVHHAGNRIITELNERGLSNEVKQIQDFLITLLPKSFNALPEENVPQGKPVHLPTHCPSCGAALKPDEVEWLDEVTAECEYCGSPVRGE